MDRLFLLAVVTVLFLTGCFTGIESTPKITANDVKKEKVVVTAEQLFLDSVECEPFRTWTQGKQFYVTDSKIALVFGSSAQQESLSPGTILEYEGCEQTVSVTGDTVSLLRFVSPSAREYVYRVDASPSELRRRGEVQLPFSVEMSLVKQVERKLLWQHYYVITSLWYDMEDEISYGRKFIPVTIVDVLPGSHVYPVKITMRDSKGALARLFMSVGSGNKSPRSFSTLLSFDDPRLKYPGISDDVWQNIIHGRVSLDMTREECRLSLGSPKEIDRRPGYNGVSELWVYENGAYLIFVDGLLRDFRNVTSVRQ